MVRLVRRVTLWWWRRSRAIQPTRDGWWCVFAAVGLGVAGVNTGNNLAYLLCATLLALIIVSGLLSDVTIRGLQVTVTLPPAFHAGQPALVLVAVANRKRRLGSYSLVVEAMDRPRPDRSAGRRKLEHWLGELGLRDRRAGGAARRLAYLARLGPGAERLISWEVTMPARGRRRLPRIRAATRFPFGLFVKTGPPLLYDETVLVYPALHPVRARAADQGSGEAAVRRRGRGHELHNLRAYRPGDEPHLIHWRTSARSGTLTIRELEEDTSEDARIVLGGSGARDPVRLERNLSRAASLAVDLLRRGVAVELVGAAGGVALDRGPAQERRILTALAVYAPAAAQAAARPGPPAGSARVREYRIDLDA